MIKHHITKYRNRGVSYAESWFQVNIFGKQFCFWDKKIVI